MTINLEIPDLQELKPRITVFGVGGAGCNAVNNMIEAGLQGVDFVVANTDAQALTLSKSQRVVQMGVAVTEGLGAGSQPEIGRAAAEETIDEINDHLTGSHMAFITAGMGGGTGTGAAPVVARAAREAGILTVGVVTKPFQFEGQRRMRIADAGIDDLQHHVDTLIVIPNQNLFRIANEKTTFADAFAMADEVLYSGVACITDLMVKDGLINLDFADVRSVMREMGKAMMGTGEASGDKRAVEAAEAAISNPLLDDVSMRGAQGLLISVTGGRDMTLFEVDEAASRVREEVDNEANIIFGATFDESLEGIIRVSVVATGIDQAAREIVQPSDQRIEELARRLKTVSTPKAAAPAPAVTAQIPQTERALDSLEEELAVMPSAAQQPPAHNGAQMAAQDSGVQITPLRRDPSLVAAQQEPADHMANVHEELVQQPGPFVPPAAEQPQEQQPRMPKVEDFPAIAQRQMTAQDQLNSAGHDEERRPRGLLARLAHGLGKRDDDSAEEEHAEIQHHQDAPQQAPIQHHPEMPAGQPYMADGQDNIAQPVEAVPQRAAAQPGPRAVPVPRLRRAEQPPQNQPQHPVNQQPAPQQPAPQQPAQYVAQQPVQPAPQQVPQQPQARRIPEPGIANSDLDTRGSAAAADAMQGDDQLEIPAFLRRQSS